MIDYDAELEKYTARLDTLVSLETQVHKLNEKAREFANGLLSAFRKDSALSSKQWFWVDKLVSRIEGIKPLYGNFKPIQVAFMIAGEHLKTPKIRLMTEKGRFAQLNFYPDSKTIKVFVDGWQGHGYRKFAGTIEEDMIKPWSEDRLDDDVRMAIESLANDPVRASKAFANKLGACIYCGVRLSDPVSKKHGYGPICAKHFGLPYGK